MIVRNSSSDTTACADSNIEHWFDSIKTAGVGDVVEFATETQFAGRLFRGARNEIEIEFISAAQPEQRLGISSNGMLSTWPRGLSDVYDSLLQELVDRV